jgi:hypothetical protein
MSTIKSFHMALLKNVIPSKGNFRTDNLFICEIIFNSHKYVITYY